METWFKPVLIMLTTVLGLVWGCAAAFSPYDILTRNTKINWHLVIITTVIGGLIGSVPWLLVN